MKRLLVLVAVPLLAACGGSHHPSSNGGLQGRVSRGPITPTCSVNQACSKPASGFTLTFSKGGKVVGRAKTGHDGVYRVSLPPGTYFVLSSQPVRPPHVSVPTGRYGRVNFSIDTEIR